MADTYTYHVNPIKVKQFLEHIQTAGVPSSKVTFQYISSVGFKSSNDRSILTIMKAIGFVDTSGMPTETWRAWRNKSQSKKVLATALRKAYATLTPQEQTVVDSQLHQAESLEGSGDCASALKIYMTILQRVPPDSLIMLRSQIQESIAKLVPKLNPAPPFPEDAQRHLAYASAAIEDGKATGDMAKLDYAVDQLHRVLQLAPWRPETYYNLGIVLGEEKHYSDAVRYLKLYLLAAPNAQQADAVQQKIYQLEYKAGAR